MDTLATLDYAGSHNHYWRPRRVLETLATCPPRSMGTVVARLRLQWLCFLQPWGGFKGSTRQRRLERVWGRGSHTSRQRVPSIGGML